MWLMLQVGSMNALMESLWWEGELPQPGVGPLGRNEEVLETLVILLLLAIRLFIGRMISQERGISLMIPCWEKAKPEPARASESWTFISKKNNSFSSGSLSGHLVGKTRV